MLNSFDHPTLVVADLGAATGAYERLLGLPPLSGSDVPELGTSSALFALSNSLLELTAPLGSAPESEGIRSFIAARGDGLLSICFGTADAAACSAELRARGVRATPPQEGSALGRDGTPRSYRIVELSPRATRGVAVAIVERPAPLFGAENAEPPDDAVFALDHVVLRTADPEAALALYGRSLGIRLALDRRFGEMRMLFFRIGGVTLEVVEDPSLGATDALYGLAYRVRDIDGANARLRSAEVDVSDVREGRKPGTRVFSVRAGTCNVPTLFLSDPSRA